VQYTEVFPPLRQLCFFLPDTSSKIKQRLRKAATETTTGRQLEAQAFVREALTLTGNLLLLATISGITPLE
jgi:hypothetical protein